MSDLSQIGVTGPEGRLGSVLVQMGCTPLVCNITNPESVEKAVDASAPRVLINCAAYTGVDDPEDNPTARERALQSNTRGPGVLRQAFDGLLIHISTGYVFDGKAGPYTEAAVPMPISLYGMSKLGGEAAAMMREPTLIVRTLDLFGHGPRTDFVRQVRDVLELGHKMELPTTLYGTPTYLPALARALVHIATMDMPPAGVLNLAGDMVVSRFRWAQVICEVLGYNPELLVPTDKVKGKAPRPLRGGLLVDKAKELGVPIESPIRGLELLAESERSDGST